jgi:OmcA/MtrC family decaheme c-type cytochrome
VCHADGAFADAGAAHEFDVPQAAAFADFLVTDDGTDVVITFSATVDGAPAAGATLYRAYCYDGAFTRETLTGDALFSEGQPGEFEVVIPGGVATCYALNDNEEVANENARFLVILRYGTNALEIAAVGDYPAAIPLAGLASNQACIDCHGESGEVGRFAPDNRGGHYSAPMSADACVVCHGFRNEYDDNDVLVGIAPPSYGALATVVHGIHNSHNFPDGVFGPTPRGTTYDVTYPTYMANCSVCHSDETIVPAVGVSALAAANAMPVTGAGCFTCHGGMDGFDFTGLEFHLDIPDPVTADCGQCHDGSLAGATVAGYHNGIVTERGGIIFAGADTSVTEGAKFDWQITGVVDDGTNLAISWTVTYDGNGVNPCNATAGPGAPVFHAAAGGNLSILRNYAQGGDYILGTNPDAAGQPGSAVNVTVDNTVCASNVATTTVPVEATDAMYGRVAIQGKPRVPSVLGGGELMAVRAFTPTYDWEIGSDDAAPERRAVVDSGECLKCHVGSMYQHGGNRVDNVDMCYLCHNTAANEEFVRVGFGVDASEAYDGRAGQNFGMKEMLHAVHSAGETTAPIVIYRGRGIYAWAGDVSQLPNWPGSGRFPVFGSDDGTGNPVLQNHTFHSPTYPRALNACGACHTDGFEILPSALEAMASTIETGDEPFGDQVNDILEGAQTSSCVTCHRGDGDGVYNPADEAAVKGHAYQNSWVPREFPEGRQTIIDAVK